MATIAKLYPLLKEMGLDDSGAGEFIEALEESSHARLEKAVEHLATKEDLAREIAKVREDLAREIAKVREDMANMKGDLIKWNVGTIIAVAGLITAIVKLIG